MKRALVLALALMTLVGLPLFAAGTPAGTQIKNQATAQYKDANGNVQSSTSNEVITIVQQIFGVTVKPDGTTTSPITQTATSGTRVYFPYTLTNTGNGPDTFDVATSLGATSFTPGNVKIYLDANGDGVVNAGDNEITNTGTVAADGIAYLIVAYDVPTAAAAGDSALVNLTATTHDGTKSDNNNWNKTTVVADAVMTITKSATVAGGTVAYPSSKINYVISGSNTGSQKTTLLAFNNIDTSGDGTVDAVSGLLVEDALPAGISVTGTPGTDFLYVAPASAIKLYGYTNDKWSKSATIDWGDSSTLNKIGMFIPGTLDAGAGYEMDWVGTVKADAAVGMLTNTAVLHWADSSTPTTGKSTSSNTTQTMINATFGVQIGPQGHPEYTGANDVTVQDSPKSGATVVFQNTVKNTGTDGDTFNISTAWTANQISGATVSLFMADGLTPLGDMNSDGVPDTGALAKGAQIDIVVKVTIPSNAASDSVAHDVTVTAKSTKDGNKSDPTIDRINKIVAGSTNLSNNIPLPGNGETPYGLTGNPGSTVTFPLIVTNNNGYPETYALDQNTALLKTGWSVIFYPDSNGDGIADPGSNPISSTPTVAAGGTYTFVAVVTIAADQVPISGDPSATPTPGTGQGLEFQATGSLSGQVDKLHDWVDVNAVYTFTFEPDNSGISTPGGTVIYQHKIKNTGNTAQTFGVILDSLPRAGWTYTFSSGGTTYSSSLSGVSVGVGAEQNIYVKVFIPSSEAIGAQDTGVVKATNNAGTPVSLSRQDTTTVVGGNLKLSKTVASVEAADNGSIHDQPGDELTYSVTYQNLDSKPLTAVFIYDKVPLYTGFKVGGAAGATTIEYSKDNGATWTYTPISAGGGAPAGYDYLVTNIRWTIGDLAGGASGAISFTVRIK